MQDSSRDFRDVPLSKASKFLCFLQIKLAPDPLNKRGLFPGPTENESLFAQRVAAAEYLPTHTDSLAHFQTLFGAKPDWVEIQINKRGLSPWEAATTWIHTEENKPRSVYIQLKSDTPPRGYTLEEILSHELVHATRVAFDEPRFEEILAFQTSKKWWRRYLGPLFNKPRDVLTFGLCLLSVWGLYLAELLSGREFYADRAVALPLLFLTYLTLRLVRSQYLFSKARTSAESLVGKERALGLLLRLSDAEILTLAAATSSDVQKAQCTAANGT
jgi:hypothetical protein